jgi:hypothetical protein
MEIRTLQVSGKYLSGGGRQWDFAGSYELKIPRKNFDFRVAGQSERWLIPIITPRTQRNLSLSFCVAYHPPRVAGRN